MWEEMSFNIEATVSYFCLHQTHTIISSNDLIPLNEEFIIEPRHDKTNKMSVRPAKTQISLGIRLVWSDIRCPHEENLYP